MSYAYSIKNQMFYNVIYWIQYTTVVHDRNLFSREPFKHNNKSHGCLIIACNYATLGVTKYVLLKSHSKSFHETTSIWYLKSLKLAYWYGVCFNSLIALYIIIFSADAFLGGFQRFPETSQVYWTGIIFQYTLIKQSQFMDNILIQQS